MGTASGAAGNDQIDPGVANIIGSNFSDQLTCDTDGFRCTVDGLKGDDTIVGTRGDDNFYGRLGNDRITGGEGPDTAHYEGTAPVTVNLTNGHATGQGTDTLAGIESAVGSSAADTAHRRRWDVLLSHRRRRQRHLAIERERVHVPRNEGNDTIVGTEAGDAVYADAGNDVIDARAATTSWRTAATTGSTAGRAPTGSISSSRRPTPSRRTWPPASSPGSAPTRWSP